MMQKPWFKLFIWFLAIFFFFLASGVVISIFKPGPSEEEAMKFMQGMMSAMDNSIMGVTMNMEEGGMLSRVLIISSYLTIPSIVLGILIGIGTRYLHRGNKNV